MNNTNNTPSGPRFLIAGFGLECKTVLEHGEWLQSARIRHENITFIQMDNPIDSDNINAMLSGIDMVFILGSDDNTTALATALELASQCKAKNIICFTLLTTTAQPGQMDTETGNLCKLSSHVLQLPDSQPDDNLTPLLRLQETVKIIIGPLLGRGLIGVDFEDYCNVLKRGITIHFGFGSAQGENRAQHAAQRAIQFTPDIHNAKGVLATITSGPDIKLDEYSAAADLVRDACNDDCTAVIVTTLDESQQGQFRLGIICVMDG